MNAEYITTKTYAELHLKIPFPATKTMLAENNGMSEEATVKNMFSMWGNEIVGLVLYDVRMVKIDDLLYTSAPINHRTYQK